MPGAEKTYGVRAGVHNWGASLQLTNSPIRLPLSSFSPIISQVTVPGAGKTYLLNVCRGINVAQDSQHCSVDAGACVKLPSGETEHLGRVVQPPRVNSEGMLHIRYALGAPCEKGGRRRKSATILFECDASAGLVCVIAAAIVRGFPFGADKLWRCYCACGFLSAAFRTSDAFPPIFRICMFAPHLF